MSMFNHYPQQREYQILPQCRSPFFSLPRELRDNIYELAFGDEARHFNYRGITTSATLGPSNERSTSLPGAPDWILACQSIYWESAEAFHRTRTLSPRYRRKTVKESVTNSWLLHKNAIRNIELRYPYSPTEYGRKAVHSALPPRMFLSYLRPFLHPSVFLTIDWETGRNFPSGDMGRRFYPTLDRSVFDNWRSEWFGQFWKVEIYMTTPETDGHDLEEFRGCAEVCAKKLVGCIEGIEEGQVRWGEDLWALTDEGVLCSRSLIVFRRQE